MRLTGTIPKQSNSAVQIWQPPWLNLQRKPELDLLPLELDFLYGYTCYGLFVENLQGGPHGRRQRFDKSCDLVQYSAKRWRLCCVIPRPGSLWPRGKLMQVFTF